MSKSSISLGSKLTNTDVAYKIATYEDKYGNLCLSYVVLVGKDAYAIEGTSTENTDNIAFSEKNFETMIQSCEIDAESSTKQQKEVADFSGDFVLGKWKLTKIVNYKGDDLTDQEPDLSIYYIEFKEDGTGVLHDGNIGEYSFTWNPTGENSPRYEWTVGNETDDFFVYNDPMIVMDISKMSDIFGDLTYTFER